MAGAALIGEAIWLHDQASVDLLGAAGRPPERVQAEWDDVRRRANELRSRCTTSALSAPPATAQDLQRLGDAVGGVTGALDTYLTLRMRPDVDDSMQAALRASTDAVELRRRDLEAAIDSIRTRQAG